MLPDARSRVICEEVVSKGILTASLAHPREVFRAAIRHAAASLILAHNHPPNDPEPSPEDIEITRRLSAVGELVGNRAPDQLRAGCPMGLRSGWVPAQPIHLGSRNPCSPAPVRVVPAPGAPAPVGTPVTPSRAPPAAPTPSGAPSRAPSMAPGAPARAPRGSPVG